jgi:hypothetical protein
LPDARAHRAQATAEMMNGFVFEREGTEAGTLA